MTRYSLINKTGTHACMEVNPAGDWVPFTEAQRLEHDLLLMTAGREQDRAEFEAEIARLRPPSQPPSRGLITSDPPPSDTCSTGAKKNTENPFKPAW